MASGPYRRLRGLLTCIMLLALAPVVAAQSITDARRVEFTPSADHNAVDPTSGVALVTKYTLDVYVAGGATPVSNADLGKPAPQSDGMHRDDCANVLEPDDIDRRQWKCRGNGQFQLYVDGREQRCLDHDWRRRERYRERERVL